MAGGKQKIERIYNFEQQDVIDFTNTSSYVFRDVTTGPEHIYNPITAMGFSAIFTFQLDNTKR